ncbi:MAG: hypothetical protein OEQ53_16650 [Saprospiraceae bacterium]|nr:hypothetical protein [Saprospiraceae bacterium]
MRTHVFTCSFTLLLFLPLILPSQDIEYSAKEYIGDDGTIYWNRSLPLYLRVSPNPEGHGVLLKSQNPAYTNPLYLDTEGTNFIRTRYAVDKDSKKTVTPIKEVMMPIVADGTSPSSSIFFRNAKRSSSAGKQFFGPELVIHISSNDKLSGVELLMYSLDDTPLVDFTEDLNVDTEGDHSVSFYAVDRVGNKELTRTNAFVVDLSPPTVMNNIDVFEDANVISPRSKISFTATDALSGVHKVFYRFDDADYREYNGSEVKFTYLKDGEHFLEYYAVDKVGNETGIFRYDFYFDKTAPLTANDILGDRFIVKDKIYFSGRTKMKLTAVDNKIGVQEIRYSMDKGAFNVYDQPFYLPSISGVHRIRYYSVDRLANRPISSESYQHDISLVYLDLTGPDITHRVKGPSFQAAGVQYISPKTQLSLVGNDSESGLQYLTYSLDGNSAEERYDSAITLNTSGKHEIELFGYDNVNNRNVGHASVFVDASPPVIYENFSTRAVGNEDGLPLYPPYVTVFLAATDDIVGNDRIYFTINGNTEKLYTKPIGQLKKNTAYMVSIRAIDKVGNESSKVVEFKTAEN